MSRANEIRVAALERAALPQEQSLVIHFVSAKGPNAVGNEIRFLSCGEQRWARLADESEDDFFARAQAEAERGSFGLTVFLDQHDSPAD